MNACRGWTPGEVGCRDCEAVGSMGIVSAGDPRYFGGHLDAFDQRHDPLRHADDCPTKHDLSRAFA